MPSPEPSTTEKPAPAPETPAAAPTATETVTLSKEQYDNLIAQNAHLSGRMDALQAGAGRQVIVERPPPEPTISEEQLAEMLESGEGRKILEAQKYIARQTQRPLEDAFVQFRGATMQTAEALGREVVEARGLIPHYSDPEIKRDVDAFLGNLPPEARANKDSLILAHNYVVGKPEHQKRIIAREVEAELRRRAGATEPGTPPAQSSERVPGGDGKPAMTLTDLFGPETAAAVKLQGKTPDEFIRKFTRGRAKSLAEYYDKYMKESEFEEEAV